MQNTKQLHYFQGFFMTESKDTKQKLLKKQDMILIAVILAAAVLLFLGAKLMHKSPAEIVEEQFLGAKPIIDKDLRCL